jgi:hypothetical protein
MKIKPNMILCLSKHLQTLTQKRYKSVIEGSKMVTRGKKQVV